ncbi:exported hypothetical protein [Candidatus Sulfopaludibacter sp. SbA3]|nr:exported hypothetical protein [Candidatus Sulfopaludibacter sp. SbA3]
MNANAAIATAIFIATAVDPLRADALAYANARIGTSHTSTFGVLETRSDYRSPFPNNDY